MRLVSRWATIIALVIATAVVSARLSGHHDNDSSVSKQEDVSECILLFGAYCNGNLGDVIQASTLSRLIANAVPDAVCVWHAHPSKEKLANGFHEGEFFASNSAGVISLGCDRESGEQASRFKGLVIGGGGLFEARHWPLDCEAFVEGLGPDLPVAIFGVGASAQADFSAPTIRRANYISGRDEKSVAALSALLGTLDDAKARPEDVARVRDPVLSDPYFNDVEGKCWQQSVGQPRKKPLCFVLPSAMTPELQVLHRVYSSAVVREGDVILNVFPKHQAEIEEYPYPVEVEPVLDPAQFASRLCGCRAVITSRLHGTIIALHAGVPTIAAWPVAHGNKVPDLMNDVLRFPDQFVLVDETLTRAALDDRVAATRKSYSSGRRNRLFEKLGFIARHTQRESSRMLRDVLGLDFPDAVRVSDGSTAGSFWEEPGHAPLWEGQPSGEAPPQAAVNAVGEAQDPPETRYEEEPPREPEESPHEPEESPERAEEELPPEPEVGSDRLGAGRAERRGRDVVTVRYPWDSWVKSWGRERVAATPPAEVVGEMTLAESPVVSLGALIMIALLALPALASLSKGESAAGTPGRFAGTPSAGTTAALWLEGGHTAPTAPCAPVLGGRPLGAAGVTFFGLNYVIWVVLAMGFNVCSKTYMRQTRSPVALLAIQGFVGVAVLCAMNLVARYRQRRCSSQQPPASPLSSPHPLPSPRHSSWVGKCGLRQAKRAGRNVWQAGLLHSCNAVLTSWSVLVGGVAATHALKALEPIAAAGFSRWLLGSTLPPGRVVAVTVIVFGLGILMLPLHLPRWAGGSGDSAPEGGSGASMGAGQDLAAPALITACACCTVALRNVLLKGRDVPPPPPPLGLLVCSVVGATVGTTGLLVPWLPCSWEWAAQPLLQASGINAALCFVGYNLASFNLLSELSPVGHAIGNASKRVCLFAAGLFLLGEEESMSPRQLAGASLAFVGMASYNLAGARGASARKPLS